MAIQFIALAKYSLTWHLPKMVLLMYRQFRIIFAFPKAY